MKKILTAMVITVMVLVMSTAAFAAPSPTSSDKTPANSTTTSAVGTSPKTGESPVLPVMIAVCAGGAVLCAVKSKAHEKE